MTLRRAVLLPPLLALATAVGGAVPDSIQVRDATVRPTPPGASTASAHLRIGNTGRSDDQLLGVASPDMARVEVHAMDMTGGVMRMRPVPGPLRVPAGGELDLSPASGRHLMLVGPKRPLRPGDHVRLVLRFARAGARTVDAPVRADRP